MADARVPFRLSPRPIGMRPATVNTIEQLGFHLAAFYRAAGRLYQDSVRGNIEAWPAQLLDRGKSDQVIALARRNRLRRRFPLVIRPDLMLSEDGGITATELDSVPGGLGVLDALRTGYTAAGFETVGLDLAGAFADGLRAQAGLDDPFVALVVSDEGEAYRPEFGTLAQALQRRSLRCRAVKPEELAFADDGVYLSSETPHQRVDVIYRFFELFDLINVPGADSMFAALQRRQVVITPPPRAPLEEKLLLALFAHRGLEPFWRNQLGDESMDVLRNHLPATWVLDPADLPPFAAIDPPLKSGGLSVRRWEQLHAASQRQRRLVVKPSGYSPIAWGSRGVTIGHDVKADEWSKSLTAALDAFEQSPHVLQLYSASRRFQVDWLDGDADRLKRSWVRGRFSPYYIDTGGDVLFAGILATACPDSSKILHGMADAVMAPVAVDEQSVL